MKFIWVSKIFTTTSSSQNFSCRTISSGEEEGLPPWPGHKSAKKGTIGLVARATTRFNKRISLVSV